MARSIAALLSGRPAQHFPRHDLAWPRLRVQQQGAVAIDAGKAAAHQLFPQLYVDIQADWPGLGEPCPPDRVESVAPPLGKAGRHGGAELLERSLDRTAEHRSRISHLRK